MPHSAEPYEAEYEMFTDVNCFFHVGSGKTMPSDFTDATPMTTQKEKQTDDKHWPTVLPSANQTPPVWG